MTHKLQHQPFVTIQDKPSYKQLEQECKDRADCEKSLTNWNIEIGDKVDKLEKENDEIKAENIALTSTMETIIKCLSEFDHNPNIQGIGQICKKKLEEIKRGDERTCKGRNCTAINGINHSSECIKEHDNNINGVSNG